MSCVTTGGQLPQQARPTGPPSIGYRTLDASMENGINIGSTSFKAALTQRASLTRWSKNSAQITLTLIESLSSATSCAKYCQIQGKDLFDLRLILKTRKCEIPFSHYINVTPAYRCPPLTRDDQGVFLKVYEMILNIGPQRQAENQIFG